jgi:hypothetical protein
MKPGAIVKIKSGFENCKEELEMLFVVVEIFEESKRASIQPTNCKLALVPTELVGLNMIELSSK